MSRKMALLSGFVLLVALGSVGAGAAPLKVLGFDDMSCRAWSKSKDDAQQRKIYLAWIRGAVTGHNYANQNQQVSAMSSGTVENFIDRYCVEKPADEFGNAAMRMMDKFSGRNEAIVK